MPTEFSMLAAAIDASNAPLPPMLGRLIQHAPESFDDQRAGRVAAVVRTMRAACEPVNLATVGHKCPQHLAFIASELSDPLSPEAAEHYAPIYWQAYESRRMAAIGQEMIHSLEASPDQARAIRTNALAALTDLAGEPNTLLEILAARRYSPSARPKEPAPRYFIGSTGICTPDNLTTLSAHAKAGKSAAKGAMLASTFASPGADCLGFASQNHHGYAVLNLDTEQSPFDHWQLIDQAKRRAQADAVPSWLLSYCLAGLTADEMRQSLRLTMEQAARQFGGIQSVFIDGIADAVHDVNDPAEAGSLVAELHALALKYHCPLLNIIHVNPGSESKTRGHLGSQLERKSETNLRLEKDACGVTAIWADKNRRAPIIKTRAPRFAWCDQAGMHVSVESSQSSKESAKIQDLRTEVGAVFTAAGKSAITYGQIIQLLTSEVHISQSTAKRRLNEMLRTRIISKQQSGLYALASK